MYVMVRGRGVANPHQISLARVVAVSGGLSGYSHARMRTRITSLIVLAATLSVAALAHAAPVPVAVYAFQSQADVAAFQKTRGAKCTKKWFRNEALALSVGP